MAKGRCGYPTPGMDPADRDHTRCPVCGWSPCTVSCRLCLSPADVVELSMMFPEDRGDAPRLREFDAPTEWNEAGEGFCG